MSRVAVRRGTVVVLGAALVVGRVAVMGVLKVAAQTVIWVAA